MSKFELPDIFKNLRSDMKIKSIRENCPQVPCGVGKADSFPVDGNSLKSAQVTDSKDSIKRLTILTHLV